ncbi:reverse transcriptase domain-containing protein [Tanacetum coccineum]
MSSSNHPTSDIEDAFSSNFPNYTPTSPDYFPASPRNISPDSSDNLSKYLLASLAIPPFHDNLYIKAYNANKPPIPPQVSIDPPPIPPPKDTKTLIESPIPPPDLITSLTILTPSQVENDETSNDDEVDDNFPGETIMKMNTEDEPWFTDFANYLVSNIVPKGMTYHQKNKFFSDLWEEPYLFKVYSDALISDKGTHFCNKRMEKTMKRYGVNYRFSTSYHPQTCGQVENPNKALKRILEKTVKDNPVIWSRKLDDALWAFHTAYKSPTRTTPYKLIYGKNYHLPFEIEHRAYWALKNCNSDLIAAGEKQMFQLHKLDELRHQAYEKSRLY